MKQHSIAATTEHTGFINTVRTTKCALCCTEVRGHVMPAVRRSAAMCSLGDGRFILSGGAGDDPDHLRSDMYQFDTTTKQWTKLLEVR
jgi:Kelch motif